MWFVVERKQSAQGGFKGVCLLNPNVLKKNKIEHKSGRPVMCQAHKSSSKSPSHRGHVLKSSNQGQGAPAMHDSVNSVHSGVHLTMQSGTRTMSLKPTSMPALVSMQMPGQPSMSNGTFRHLASHPGHCEVGQCTSSMQKKICTVIKSRLGQG